MLAIHLFMQTNGLVVEEGGEEKKPVEKKRTQKVKPGQSFKIACGGGRGRTGPAAHWAAERRLSSR